MSEIVKYTIDSAKPEIELWLSKLADGACLMGRDPKGTVKELIRFKSDGSILLRSDAQLNGLYFSNDGCLLVQREEKA